MAGVDLVTLAALLGHSKLAMVTRYAHPTEAHQFEALKKLQAFMGKTPAVYFLRCDSTLAARVFASSLNRLS